jgi:hypothetical protein
MARYRPSAGLPYNQYGDRPSAEVRSFFLLAALEFVRASRSLPGMQRIALVGSLTTPKPYPKDIDLLVTVADDMDLERLATLGRRLLGAAQRINGGADVFLCNPEGEYIGRSCPWRECAPGRRVRCGARYRSGRQYLRDDLDQVKVSSGLIESPPILLWPSAETRVPLPQDVNDLLFGPLRREKAT